MDDWRWMTAADLGRGIAAGDIDPVALTETYLAAIDAHPHRTRIYARVTHDRARAEGVLCTNNWLLFFKRKFLTSRKRGYLSAVCKTVHFIPKLS